MENAFSLLEENDDVLLLNQDSFTVRRLKDLIEQAISTKIKTTVRQDGLRVIDINFCKFSIGNQVELLLNDIQWSNSLIDCQLLKVGSQGWQKGKLRIQINTKILFDHDSDKISVCIGFCPQESTESESS